MAKPESRYPITVAARLADLTPYVIRIWEQRYAAVEPRRTGTNRRLYSDEDIARLRLLKRVRDAGFGLGEVARLSSRELERLAVAPAAVEPTARSSSQGSSAVGVRPGGKPFVTQCLDAVTALDTRELNKLLKHAASELGAQGVLHSVVAPLSQQVGELWRKGKMTAAHEHFATAALRGFLTALALPYGGIENGPGLIVATPAGQLHEVGALLVSAMAANLGWHVTHLGASVPAAEIAGAARQKRARAVALSLVYPGDDPHLPGELALLRELLPDTVAILAGGRAAESYREALLDARAIVIGDLTAVGDALDSLREKQAKA